MSDLLKASRAMQDDHFKWRVAAGIFYYAAQNISTFQVNSKEHRFATWALMNPGSADPSMIAFAATDPAILAKIVLQGPAEEVPDTSEVEDADILRVIGARWGLVAVKYQPAATTPAPTAGG